MIARVNPEQRIDVLYVINVTVWECQEESGVWADGYVEKRGAEALSCTSVNLRRLTVDNCN